MTRKKIADNEPNVPVESAAAAPAKAPVKKARAPRASAKAVTHKHKKSGLAVTSETAPEALPPTREEIAKLAYSYWEARGYQGGSDQEREDWLRAERELWSQRSR
jgi:Protein of unknown function (DUF2934)